MVNRCTKFEVPNLSRSKNILDGLENKNGSRVVTTLTWCDHAHFRDSLSSVGWDLLWSANTRNLKSLCSPTTKIWKTTQNVEIMVAWRVTGHPKSPKIPPFD